MRRRARAERPIGGAAGRRRACASLVTSLAAGRGAGKPCGTIAPAVPSRPRIVQSPRLVYSDSAKSLASPQREDINGRWDRPERIPECIPTTANMKHSFSIKTSSLCHRYAAIAGSVPILIVIVLVSSASPALAQTGLTGIFGGGPFYKDAASITEIETSGFTEAIVWSVEVSSTGDLNFNGEFPLTSNGAYIGDQTYPDFASNMALLKQGTVKRVTFSVGSSNVGDWQHITALVQSQGTGTNSILYKDFQALKAAIPALDAIDFDDENSFNAPTTIAFGVMLGQLGYHVAPDAFDNASYWTNVVSQINNQLADTVDGVHLQAYAGGSGNNPCVGWNFGTVPVWPGLWDQVDTPSEVQSIMSGWNSQCGINGGFLWLYDDIVGTGLAAQYASAINNAVAGSGFTLSGPATLFLNQNAAANAIISITDFGGFTGIVTLTVSGLPKGVQAFVKGQGNKQRILFKAGASAKTGFTAITITGTSGTDTQTLPLTVAVSSGVGTTGSGTQVDLSA